MNQKDSEAVEFLRSKTVDLLTPDTTDFDLLRWLQGYDYNLPIIVPKLRRALSIFMSYDWKKHKTEEVIEKYWPYGLLGPSGMGNSLVYIECQGRTDGDGVLKSINVSDFTKCVVKRLLEVLSILHEYESQTGQQWSLINVVDLEGMVLNEKQWSIITGPFKILIQFTMDQCVEVVQKIIVINAPSYLYHMLRVVRHFLPTRTRKKMIILGSNWKVQILDHISPAHLPKHWGGNLVDEKTGDEICSSLVNVPPPKVDPSFLWVPNEKEPKTADLTVLTVGPWKTECVTIHVKKSGTLIHWYFWASSDYGFGVFHSDRNEQITHQSVIESLEAKSTLALVYPYIDRLPGPSRLPEKDQLVCQKTGYYKIIFNNAFSWIHSLKISYKIDTLDGL